MALQSTLHQTTKVLNILSKFLYLIHAKMLSQASTCLTVTFLQTRSLSTDTKVCCYMKILVEKLCLSPWQIGPFLPEQIKDRVISRKDGKGKLFLRWNMWIVLCFCDQLLEWLPNAPKLQERWILAQWGELFGRKQMLMIKKTKPTQGVFHICIAKSHFRRRKLWK